MRVLLYVADQNPHRDGTLGITSYTDGLARALVGAGVDVRALVSTSSYRPPAPTPVRVLPFPTDRLVGRLVSDHASPVLRGGYDLWHWPKGFASALLSPRGASVGTVHDTIVMHYAERYPETRSRLEFEYWRRLLARSLERFDRVCTVSEHARGQILAFCEREGILPPPIDVTYQGARYETRAGGTVVRGDYVLHVGSSLPHKGTDTLLAHWGTLEARGVTLPRLVVLGALDARQREAAARLRHVETRGRVEEAAFEAALAGAGALVLPSEIEGFGLPALEAYYLGTPVAYVRGTAVEEVLGDRAPGGFELSDPDSLALALDAVLALSADAVRERARALAARFAWRACAERTIKSYRCVLA